MGKNRGRKGETGGKIGNLGCYKKVTEKELISWKSLCEKIDFMV